MRPDPALLSSVFTGCMLLAAFFAIGRTRLTTFLRHYAASSACLAGVILVSAAVSGNPAEYAGAAATLVLKVVLIPLGLLRTARKLGDAMRLTSMTRPVLSYTLAAASVAGAWLLARRLPLSAASGRAEGGELPLAGLLFVALALILLGFLLIIIRRDLYSQIIGFLTLENGISAFAVVALGGVPFLMEMGIFAVAASGVVLMAILSGQVHALYASHDTDALRELTD